MDTARTAQSPAELFSLGERIYFEKKDELEKKHLGKFAVIEVESKEIFIDADKLTAVQRARKKHPQRLFYIVQIGNLVKPSGSDINRVVVI